MAEDPPRGADHVWLERDRRVAAGQAWPADVQRWGEEAKAIAREASARVAAARTRRTIVDKFVDNLAALVESRMPQRTQVKLKVMRGKQVKLNMPQRTQVETSFRLELHWSATERTGASSHVQYIAFARAPARAACTHACHARSSSNRVT